MFQDALDCLVAEYEKSQAIVAALTLENENLRKCSNDTNGVQNPTTATSDICQARRVCVRMPPVYLSESTSNDNSCSLQDIILRDTEASCLQQENAINSSICKSISNASDNEDNVSCEGNRHRYSPEISPRHSNEAFDPDADLVVAREYDGTLKPLRNCSSPPRRSPGKHSDALPYEQQQRPMVDDAADKISMQGSNVSDKMSIHWDSVEKISIQGSDDGASLVLIEPVRARRGSQTSLSSCSSQNTDLISWLDPIRPGSSESKTERNSGGPWLGRRVSLQNNLEVQMDAPHFHEGMMIDPVGKFRLSWDACGCVLLLCELWVAPFELIFLAHVDDIPRFFEIVAVSITIFFTVDIALNFFTGYVANGEKVMERTLIVKRYLQLWFWLDVLATAPWDLLLSLSGDMFSMTRVTKASKFWRTLRYLKMLRAIRLVKTMDMVSSVIRHSQGSHLLEALRKNATIISFLAVLCVVSHLHGIVWAVLQPTWSSITTVSDALEYYVESYWWSFCALSAGAIGNHCGFQSLGIHILEAVIGIERLVLLTVMIQHIFKDALPESQKGGVDDRRVIEYLREHKVSYQTQIKALFSLRDTGKAKELETNTDDALKISLDLPRAVQRQINIEMWSTRLKSLGLILRVSSWAENIVDELSQCAFEVIHPSQASIFLEGDNAVAAYHIVQGELFLTQHAGQMQNTWQCRFTQGMWVGENSLVSPSLRYPASCTTCVVSSLMVVQGKDFLGVISKLGLMTYFEEFCSDQLWRGFCGRCLVLGHHFTNNCPTANAGLATKQKKEQTPGSKCWGCPTIRKCSTIKERRAIPVPDASLAEDLNQFLRCQNLLTMRPILQRNFGEVRTLDALEKLTHVRLEELVYLMRLEHGTQQETMKKALSAQSFARFKFSRKQSLRRNLFHGMSRLQHFVFLSHYKLEAGTEAALMRTEMEHALCKDPASLAHHFDEPVFLDSDNLESLEHLQERVGNTHNLVLLLTPGVLTRPWVLVELVTARRKHSRVLPVSIARPGIGGFEFPDEDWLHRLRDGDILDCTSKDVLEKHQCPMDEVADAVAAVFQQIALTYSPHKAKHMRQAEIDAILQRCRLRKGASSSSLSWEKDSEDRSRALDGETWSTGNWTNSSQRHSTRATSKEFRRRMSTCSLAGRQADA